MMSLFNATVFTIEEADEFGLTKKMFLNAVP